MSPHVKFILYFSFCIDLIFLQDFFLYMHVLFLLWGSIFCSVFSFNNRAIEKALLLHFLFKSRKFCFLEAGEVIRQRPDNRRDDIHRWRVFYPALSTDSISHFLHWMIYFYNYYLLGAHETVEIHISIKFMKKVDEIPVLFIGFVGFLGCNSVLHHIY